MDKRKSLLVLFSVFLLIGTASAQSSIDGFEDGDYTNNPTWNVEFGTASNYQVTTASALNGTYGVELNNVGTERHRLTHASTISQGERITGWFKVESGDLNNLAAFGLIADGSWGSTIQVDGVGESSSTVGDIVTNGGYCTEGAVDTGVNYNRGDWIKFGIVNEGGNTQRMLAWDQNGNNIVNLTRECMDWDQESIGVSTTAFSGGTNSFTGTLYHDDVAFEGYVPSTTTPISNLNITSPVDGSTYTYYDMANGVDVNANWDNPDSLSTDVELDVGIAQNVDTTTTTSNLYTYTITNKSLWNVGSSNGNGVGVSVSDSEGTNIFESLSLTINNPRHTATTVSPTSSMLRMNGESINVEMDYQIEGGETVNLVDADGNNPSFSYTCNQELCSETYTNTPAGSSQSVSYQAIIQGQDSGYSDSGTAYDVTWYEPSLTYNGPTDGSTVSYVNRQQTLDYTWDSSNDESVTAYLYYNGNQIRTDNLSPGQSITESVEGNIGQNDWYVEVVGDQSGDTETFSIQSFTVDSPINTVSSDSPADGTDYDSGTNSVNIEGSYETDSTGTVELIVDGVVEESVTVNSEGVSGSISTNYPTQDGQTYTWNVVFNSDSGNYDDSSTSRSFEVLPQLAVANSQSPNNNEVISWNNRDVTFNWLSDSNEPYTTTLDIDGVEEYTNSYVSRGSNTDSHTETLGDPTQDTTYSWTVETVGDNTGVSDSETRTLTVEQPVLEESVTLLSPNDDTTYSVFNEPELEAEVSSNDVSEVRFYVNNNLVHTDTIGDNDRTNTVTETLNYTNGFDSGNYTWRVEVGNEVSETRNFEVVEQVLSFDYINPAEGEEVKEGVGDINYTVDVTTERGGEVSIIEKGNTIYSENISVASEGTTETIRVQHNETNDEPSGTVNWTAEFRPNGSNNILKDGSSSYEVIELPTAILDTPEDGVYFRENPATVNHVFNVSNSNLGIDYELVLNGNVVDSGSASSTNTVQYTHNESGQQEWYVNTSWTDGNGEDKQSEVRTYNTGNEDIAEGGLIDQFIETVSDQIGLSYIGTAILINLLVSLAVMTTVMTTTKSVGYSMIGGFLTFFGLGTVGFLPTVAIVVIGLVGVLALGYYLVSAFFGDN